MAANKLLSADRLFALLRANFEQATDQRAENAKKRGLLGWGKVRLGIGGNCI